MKNKDVSILVNNVGFDNVNEFINTPPEILKNLLLINCFPPYFMTQLFLPSMLKRKTKSAVINISSMSAVHPVPYFSAYGATKSFVDYLSQSLHREYPTIDWISVKPNFVDTNINNHMKMGLQTVEPAGVVDGVLHDLGKYTETFGHWKHEIINSVIRMIPYWLIKPVFMNVMIPKIKGHHDKHREELEKKNS